MKTLPALCARLAVTLWLVPVRCYQRSSRRFMRALSALLVGRPAVVDIAARGTWPMPAVLPTATRSGIAGGSSQLVSARMTRQRLEIHPERPLVRESIAGRYTDGTPIPPVVEEREIDDYATVKMIALPPSLPPPVAMPHPTYRTHTPTLPVAITTREGILLREALPERLSRSALN
jgi:hypothetical protein